VVFFIFWPTVAVISCLIAADMNWWFPKHDGTLGGTVGSDEAFSPIGQRIDNLFDLILIITTVTFIGTHIALGYVLWRGAKKTDTDEKAVFTHGSHNLEVLWTIVPAGILLFIALFQMDTWAEYRVKSLYAEEAVLAPVAEVTARQFEWRFRYPAPDRKFKTEREVQEWLERPQPDDLYTVNELAVPTNQPIVIHLRSMDVQHSFFVPKLRVKQDAVPGLVIPIQFEVIEPGDYELLCAELCGWGHYKMGARLLARTAKDYRAYLLDLQKRQNEDGVTEPSEEADPAEIAADIE
jgi:cytochrome c oxidase subunit 2